MTAKIQSAEEIARAVLYEGYMLYPYRASSTKNQFRTTFGTLYPEEHPDVLRGAEQCLNQAELLAKGRDSTVTARVRFLQMQASKAPGAEQGIERVFETEFQVREIVGSSRALSFEFPSSSAILTGKLVLSARELQKDKLFRLTLETRNTSRYIESSDRTQQLASSFVSAHTVVAIDGGEFLSLLDPPEDLSDAAAACKNVGLYPVLVGEANRRDVVLASPIILYDYPQVAPESAGDFFDGTEMDEMLTLRVMTLTDSEKQEMSSTDARTRELLARTEATAREQLARTHGTIRNLRPIKDKAA